MKMGCKALTGSVLGSACCSQESLGHSPILLSVCFFHLLEASSFQGIRVLQTNRAGGKSKHL